MFKKVLTTTVLGVSALGVITANAAESGLYITGQVGYANTHMKGKTNIASLNKAIPVLDFTPSNDKDTNLSNNGLAGRVAIGYQFNPHFAVETGYLRLDTKKVDGSITSKNDSATLKLQQNAIDFVGKGIVPVSNNVSLYGKLGVAYLTTNIEGKIPTQKADVSISGNKAANLSQHKFAPEAALGVNYDITSNVSVDTSWTHIQPIGKNRPGNIDFVAVGLGYNFG